MKAVKALFALLLVSLAWALPAPAQGQRPVVVAASATSSTSGSAPILCLLDENCNGYWAPERADGAVNEGIYLRFQEPVELGYIMIELEGDLDYLSFQVYLDAQGASPRLEDKRRRDANELEIVSGYHNDGQVLVRAVDYVLDEASGDYYPFAAAPLNYAARSVFIKVEQNSDENPFELTAIKFYGPETPDDWGEFWANPLKLELPRAVKATATASSTLEPAFAYDVSRLFDSQSDMAWSTDGKKSGGKGESLSVIFENEEEIAGLMVWNGYQRSDVHYKSNGRVKVLGVGGESVKLKDEQGLQTVMLKKPQKGKSVRLAIEDIYPGGAYNDVLISELRFVTPGGGILLPLVKPQAPAMPEKMKELADRTYVSFLHEVVRLPSEDYHSYLNAYGPESCYDSSLRLRSNGSFVIYSDTGIVDGEAYTGIIEGNWEPRADGRVRLFGKRYAASLGGDRGMYLALGNTQGGNSSLPAPRIFQSNMEYGRFSALSPEERLALAAYMIESRKGEFWEEDDGPKGGPERRYPVVIMATAGGHDTVLASARDDKNLPAVLAERLLALDPVYVKSDVYTGLLLPHSQVEQCGR